MYEATGAGLDTERAGPAGRAGRRILADAVADDPATPGPLAGEEAGRRLGEDRPRRRGHPLAIVNAALVDLGFEPRPDGPDALVLGNCPFHQLAQRQPALICGLNVAFVDGLLRGLDTTSVRAELQPRPDGCCVRLTT